MLITDLLIQKLNDEIMYWQKEALSASTANDQAAVQKALKAQGEAIDTLIKLIEKNKQK